MVRNMFGAGELIILAIIIVVVLSASRMGALGNALGKFVYSFRKAARGQDFVDVSPRPPGRLPKAEAEDAEVEATGERHRRR